jgi:hypothetical protein
MVDPQDKSEKRQKGLTLKGLFLKLKGTKKSIAK